MGRVARMLLALAGLPLLWALGGAFLEGLAAGALNGPVLTAGRVGFVLGAAAMLALYCWKRQALMVAYVFAHEMTHALVGLCCLARVRRVSVQETGGFVELSKSNWVIALAPYCVPLYLLAAVLVCWLTEWLWPGAVPRSVWGALFGFLALFHVLYTVDALVTVAQPDIHAYGWLFSYWLILAVNLLAASLALTVSRQVGAVAQGVCLLRWTARTYAAVARGTFTGARQILATFRRPQDEPRR